MSQSTDSLRPCPSRSCAAAGNEQVPTIRISGLSEAEKRAIVIADNKLAEEATWDVKELKLHLERLLNLDFDVELTGFSTGEVDLIIDGLVTHDQEPVDDLTLLDQGPPVCQRDDEWQLGDHRLLCGDALIAENYARLLKDEAAQMIVADPPYNVKINSVVGRGQIRPSRIHAGIRRIITSGIHRIPGKICGSGNSSRGRRRDPFYFYGLATPA